MATTSTSTTPANPSAKNTSPPARKVVARQPGRNGPAAAGSSKSVAAAAKGTSKTASPAKSTVVSGASKAADGRPARAAAAKPATAPAKGPTTSARHAGAEPTTKAPRTKTAPTSAASAAKASKTGTVKATESKKALSAAKAPASPKAAPAAKGAKAPKPAQAAPAPKPAAAAQAGKPATGKPAASPTAKAAKASHAGAATAVPPAKERAAKKAPAVKGHTAAKTPTVKEPSATGAAAKGATAKLVTAAAQGHTSSAPRTGSGLLSSRRRELPARRTEGYTEERFLNHQRHALEVERATYLEQAKSLRAEAESLVEEMEPGDIQFDDESGEGGTVTVDRERDLALSAQALIAVDEIDHALAKMATNTYGICENCGRLIPKARLEALPYARLCIDCKSGGLSRR